MTVNNQITTPPVPTPATERFSWSRVCGLYAYYAPVLRKQCVIYGAVSLICAILLLLPVSEGWQTGFFTLIWTVLPLMYLLSPCAFGQHSSSPIVERLLPARASEKMTFFLTYLLLVLPVVTYLLPCLAMWVYQHVPAIQTEAVMSLYELKASNPLSLAILNKVTALSSLFTCLFVVENARTNKIIKGIISVFAVNFIEGILGAAYGISYAFTKGVQDGMASSSSADPNAITMTVIHEMSTASGYMIFMYTVFTLYTGLMIWLVYRTLKLKNL